MPFWRRKIASGFGPVETKEIKAAVARLAPETVVTVSGRATMESSPSLRSLLLQLLRKRLSPVIVIDISEVTKMDTSGVATFLELLPLARQKSIRLRLVGVRNQPRMLIELTSLAEIFAVAGSEVIFS